MNVRFFGGTRAQYDSLPIPRNPLGLYFCSDTNELFWGDRLLTDGVRAVPAQADLPELAHAADGVVYYVTETRNGYMRAPDKSRWLQTIYAPVTDAYEVPESEIYNTVTTVGAVRDIEAKIYDTIDERIANIEIGTSNTGVKTISFAGIELMEADGVFTIDRACARRALGFVVPEGQEDTELEFITAAYVDNKIAEAKLSSDYVVSEIPFESAKIVTKAIGGFNEGDNVQGLTYAQLFTKLLGLVDSVTPENPTSIIESILENNTVMYQIDENDTMVKVPFNLITYTSSEAPTVNDGQTGFYQVLDESSKRVEAGYQHYSTSKEPYYIVALPEVLNVASNDNTELQTWDAMEGKWSTASYTLTNDYEQIVVTYAADGITPPATINGYQLWADLSMSDPGTIYRFIIKE